MTQYNRTMTSDDYRYGFNGKEKDGDLLGDGVSTSSSSMALDYGFRIYNPAVGRFLSVDPLTGKYPMLTPYQFASNRPIDGIDLDGLEYDDSKLNIFINAGKTEMTISGEIEIRVKIVNLSSQALNKTDAELHDKKSSKTFDLDQNVSRYLMVSINPESGEKYIPAKGMMGRSEGVDVNFKFISTDTKLSDLKKGDIALLLVDDIPGDPAGMAYKTGNVYAIEIDHFNKANHIDTHEKGHLIGDLLDRETRETGARDGFLMSYIGDGYKLYRRDVTDLLDQIIYERALQILGYGKKNTDTKQQALDFIKEEELLKSKE